MNIKYCSTCSTSFDVDEEGMEGEFGIIPVAFCATCRVCLRDMAEQEWDLVPSDMADGIAELVFEDMSLD
jgi:hypothetical protein